MDQILNRLQANQRVLFVWNGQPVERENFQLTVEKIQEKCGIENKVCVEHLNRLGMANYEKSSFDVIISNALVSNDDTLNNHDSKTLAEFLRLLKPKGILLACDKPGSNLSSELKLNGYTNASETSLNPNVLSLFSGEKPNFEIGASSRLKFANKVATTATEKPKVWQFNANDIQEDDLINTDDLLDDLDLKKPTPIDKFDCGTSNAGKKKACKNCSCGLAEEIEKEASEVQKKNVTESSAKSACGSCYLGDAFRCASCPYLGMPAFKPGEKVQLNGNFIKADL